MDRCTRHFAWARRSWRGGAVACVRDGVRATHRGRRRHRRTRPLRGRGEGQQPGRGRTQRWLRARHDHRAGQAHRRSVRAEPAGRGAGAAPRQGFREELRLPPGRGSARPRVRPRSTRRWSSASTPNRSTASPPRWACRCGPSRGPSPCCGWRSTTAAGRAWSRWPRPTPRARWVFDWDFFRRAEDGRRPDRAPAALPGRPAPARRPEDPDRSGALARRADLAAAARRGRAA